MLSLLALSLVLSSPVAATQAAVAQTEQGITPSQLVLPPGMKFDGGAEPVPTTDGAEVHPNSEVCYKIRAYIFSTGRNPKFLRETTCGPKAPTARQTNGAEPRFMPLDMKISPAESPEK